MNSFEPKADYKEFEKVFLEENSKINLISKNEERFLYEKHVYDSLSIVLFLEKYFSKKYLSKEKIALLDIGCGGGFPSVPIAIEFPEISVTGIDSIGKKINAVNSIKEKIGLKNLTTICGRAENIKDRKFDIVVSRAVADLSKISEYAFPLLKKGGYFVAYKSKKALTEIESAKKVFQKYNARVIEIIEYTLPLEEKYERNLVVISY